MAGVNLSLTRIIPAPRCLKGCVRDAKFAERKRGCFRICGESLIIRTKARSSRESFSIQSFRVIEEVTQNRHGFPARKQAKREKCFLAKALVVVKFHHRFFSTHLPDLIVRLLDIDQRLRTQPLDLILIIFGVAKTNSSVNRTPVICLVKTVAHQPGRDVGIGLLFHSNCAGLFGSCGCPLLPVITCPTS